jgi:RIO kinase 1
MTETDNSSKIFKKLARKVQKFEKERLMKKKDFSSMQKTMEEVFDQPTLMTLYNLLNKGIIDEIHGVFKSGKESRIYLGINDKGKDLAIKIYLTSSAEFRKGMLKYVSGDQRFKNVRRSKRSLIYLWAQREYKNLQRAKNSGVKVPEPYHVEKNVLVMEFIGEDGIPAPLLKEKTPSNPDKMYLTLLEYMKILYQDAQLVHGDLSEYNIMNFREDPIIFDLSQAVPLEHPNVELFLKRDVNNINQFFSKLGVKVRDDEEMISLISQDQVKQ